MDLSASAKRVCPGLVSVPGGGEANACPMSLELRLELILGKLEKTITWAKDQNVEDNIRERVLSGDLDPHFLTLQRKVTMADYVRRLEDFLYEIQKAKEVAAMEKEMKEQEYMSLAEAFKEELFKGVSGVMESEMSCVVCNELFVGPCVLDCGHTFCKYCIYQWTREKRECPICRAIVHSCSHHVEMDNFIAKFHALLPREVEHKRNELIREREAITRNMVNPLQRRNTNCIWGNHAHPNWDNHSTGPGTSGMTVTDMIAVRRHLQDAAFPAWESASSNWESNNNYNNPNRAASVTASGSASSGFQRGTPTAGNANAGAYNTAYNRTGNATSASTSTAQSTTSGPSQVRTVSASVPSFNSSVSSMFQNLWGFSVPPTYQPYVSYSTRDSGPGFYERYEPLLFPSMMSNTLVPTVVCPAFGTTQMFVPAPTPAARTGTTTISGSQGPGGTVNNNGNGPSSSSTAARVPPPAHQNQNSTSTTRTNR